MRAIVFGMFFLASSVGYASAAEIENVKFSDAYRIGDVTLRLNNVGLMRYKVFFKAMVAGLYINEGTPPNGVLTDVPKRLEIEYFWALKAKDVVKASEKLLSENIDEPTLKKLQPQLDQMHSLYEDIQPGDRYALTYLPGRGTYLSLNGETKGLVPGADFGAVYFSIWLGKNPMDASLKQQLLSGRS
jgi:hypothetical protein